MYQNVTIENFRGITSLEIDDFKKVNLFVGKNNCGKTTVLEALFLLTGPVNAELPLRINAFRGYSIIEENSWRLIFNNLNVDKYITIKGKQTKPEERRVLVIKPKTKSKISTERLLAPIHEYITETGDIYSKSRTLSKDLNHLNFWRN